MGQRKLRIQEFLESHSDSWESVLTEKPYCLSVSRDVWEGRNLLMLKYSQIDSDFNEEICRECRGIVFDEKDMSPVSIPFFKFGNVNEGSWVEEIDWTQKPYVLTKVDGSLIKIVKIDGKLLISTNGTILADKAPLADQIGCKAGTFGDLVDEGLSFCGLTRESLCGHLEEGCTYMFELTSPWNKVVVPHHETKLWFIGVRNNSTFEESFIMDHPLAKVFDTPELHDFSSFEACVETAKNLPWNEEGYVITSRDFKRNKAKSLGYLSCHHLKNNGVMSYERAVELVKLNEVDEVVSYFPEFKDALLEVKEKYEKLLNSLEASWDGFMTAITTLAPRKEAALWIQKNFDIPGCGFAMLDGKVKSPKEYLEKMMNRSVARALGYKNAEGESSK